MLFFMPKLEIGGEGLKPSLSDQWHQSSTYNSPGGKKFLLTYFLSHNQTKNFFLTYNVYCLSQRLVWASSATCGTSRWTSGGKPSHHQPKVVCNDHQSQSLLQRQSKPLCHNPQVYCNDNQIGKILLWWQSWITEYWSGKPMRMFKQRGEQKEDKPGIENFVKA